MKNIIFDCDNTMGVKGCDVDDGLALLYLLGNNNIKICGITTAYGNSDVETVYANTLQMLKDINRTDISLLKGCPDKNSLESEAAYFIVETVNAYQGNISILATGSLTNLFAAYQVDNHLFDKVNEIVLMGGITEPLIINGKVMKELNFSCDPLACSCVLAKGKNVTVITGNNCLGAYFTENEFIGRLSGVQPAAGYIKEKCLYWFEQMMKTFQLDGFHNWDVVAAAYLTDPSMFENNNFNLEPDPENLRTGLLTEAAHNSAGVMINLPNISNLKIFTDNVYQSWLNNKF